MFEVGVVAQFEAAHRLRGDFGPATRLHGHTYRVEIVLRGSSLRPDGTLYDIGHLQAVVQAAVQPLHYRDLEEVEGIAGRNTTAEIVALYLHEQIGPQIRGNTADLLTVRVWESPQAFATYEGSLGVDASPR